VGSAAKHVLHEALLWGAIALSGFALFYFFDDLKAALGPGVQGSPTVAGLTAGRLAEDETARSGFGGEVRLKADERGQFVLDVSVNDRPATFMAETGATLVVRGER
jgi:aspartyl protease family protein